MLPAALLDDYDIFTLSKVHVIKIRVMHKNFLVIAI